MTHFAFVPADSRLFIHASSSIHGIHTDADGVEGTLELTFRDDGSIDLDAPVAGSLRFEISRLKSGNPLNDRETERRIESRRYPLVEASVSSLALIGPGDEQGSWRYRVGGVLTLHGVTRDLDGEITMRTADDGRGGRLVQIWGEQVLDVRAWKIKPPNLGLIKVHPDVRVRLEATAS